MFHRGEDPTKKWYFQAKRYPDGIIRKFKARFFLRGDIHEDVIDYKYNYSLVVSWWVVRLLITLSLKKKWETLQL